jgi:hypothetical protein
LYDSNNSVAAARGSAGFMTFSQWSYLASSLVASTYPVGAVCRPVAFVSSGVWKQTVWTLYFAFLQTSLCLVGTFVGSEQLGFLHALSAGLTPIQPIFNEADML